MHVRHLRTLAFRLAATMLQAGGVIAQESDEQLYECVTTTTTTTKTWREDGKILSVTVSTSTRVCTPIEG